MAKKRELVRAVLDLRAAGCSVEEIAKLLDIPVRRAERLLHEALAQSLPIEEARTLELVRLDTLLKAYWEQALSGDIDAAEFVRKLVETRAKVAGVTERKAFEAEDIGLVVLELFRQLRAAREELSVHEQHPALPEGGRE